MKKISAIHQVMVGAAPGSSIWNEAVALRAALLEGGYRSEIFAGEIHAAVRGEAIPFANYKPADDDALIYHYSTSTLLTTRMQATQCPLILVYHNVTPSAYFANTNPLTAAQLDRARDELPQLAARVRLAIAHSEFSRRDLVAAGFGRTATVPVLIAESLFSTRPDREIVERFSDGKLNLLSVGRIVPNKKHEDSIKTIYFYRRIHPQVRFMLVGASDNAERYAAWLRQLTDDLGLTDAVHFAEHVSEAQLAAYYRVAHVLLSMSEHEGFCMPLVEAMRFGIPIVALASSAIPETLQGSGVLIRKTSFPVIAEMIELLRTDDALRTRIVTRQTARALAFQPSAVLDQWRSLIHVALGSVA